MKVWRTFLFIPVTAACLIFARPIVAAVDFDQSHAIFDDVLKQYVKNARVDYEVLAIVQTDCG